MIWIYWVLFLWIQIKAWINDRFRDLPFAQVFPNFEELFNKIDSNKIQDWELYLLQSGKVLEI